MLLSQLSKPIVNCFFAQQQNESPSLFFLKWREVIMDMIVNLIVYLVVFGLIWWLVGMLPLPAPVAQIVRVLFIILLIVIILSAFGVLPGGYLPSIKI